MELLIGLDIGTTALKVACFDKKVHFWQYPHRSMI